MEESTGGRWRENLPLVLAVGLAAAVRVAYLLIYSSLPDWDQLTVDNYYHINWASEMLSRGLFDGTTYFRAPGYIYALAGLYAVFGVSLWVARLFGFAIGVVSVYLTYRIGERVFNRKVGLTAAIIQAVYPVVIYFEGEVLLDPLFGLLLQAAVYSLLRWWDGSAPRGSWIGGVFIGLACITRPTALILIPLFLIVLLFCQKDFRNRLSAALQFVVPLAVIVGFVFARNLIVAGDPVLIASQGGINLYISNNDTADGMSATLPEPLGFNWRIEQITHIAEEAEGRELRPGEVSSYWLGRATDWILTHPGKFTGLYVERLYHSISDREISNNRPLGQFFDKVWLLRYNPLTFGILFGLTVMGALIGFGRNRMAWFLFILIATFVVVNALFFFSSRFRLPLLPYYILLSSYCLYLLVAQLRQQTAQAFFVLGGVVVFCFVSFYPLVRVSADEPAQYLTSKGLYYFAKQNYRQALVSFREGAAIDSAFPEMNLNMGASFVRLGEVDSALYYFERERRFHPGRVKADINIASLRLVNGEYEEALNAIETPLVERPYDILANQILIRALGHDSAVADEALMDSIRAAAGRTSNDIFLLNDAAALLSERNMAAQAESTLVVATLAEPPPIETDDEAFERVFRNSTENWRRARAKSFYQLGFLSGSTGRYSEAISYSKEAIRLDSTLAEAYVNLASGYLSLGNIEEARQVITEGLRRFPHNHYLGQLRQAVDQ